MKGSATLTFPSPGPGIEQVQVEVPPGRSILEAIQSVNRASRQPLVPVVNGTTTDLSYILQPGDEVTFLPQISGG